MGSEGYGALRHRGFACTKSSFKEVGGERETSLGEGENAAKSKIFVFSWKRRSFVNGWIWWNFIGDEWTSPKYYMTAAE